MKTLLALFLIGRLHAQTLGAIESFSDADNADSWNFYDYASDSFDAPNYTIPGSNDPEIYAPFTDNRGVSLFANDMSSGGWFTGDFTAAGIAEIASDIYIEDASSFDAFEFYFISDGVFYYSTNFSIEEDGWSNEQISLSKDDWFIFENEEFVFTTVTPETLSTVEEIGVNFFPTSNAADGKIVALDNFNLLPDLTPVELKATTEGNEVKISFNALAGIEYALQQSPSLLETTWLNAESPFRESGQVERTFTPAGKNFFRVLIDPLVIDTPAGQ